MRAVRVDGPRRVSIIETPRPAVVDPGDAIVRVTTSSIGPAELEQFARPATDRAAVTLGGACAGIVDETGRAVSRWRVGDAVVVPAALRLPAGDPARGLARSSLARSDPSGRDAGLAVLGRDLPGTLAGWVRVPAADANAVALPRPAELAASAAVAAGEFATALRACRQAARARPRSVCVVGCGPTGLAFLLAWKATAAERGTAGSLFAADPSPFRVAVARRLGATGVVVRDEAEAAAELRAKIGGSFDLVVAGPECEGASTGVASCLADPDSGLVALDAPGRCRARFGPTDHPVVPDVKDVADAVDLLAGGSIDLLPLVSHTFPLAEAQAAFDTAFGRARGVLKVLLKP